jgi:TetR/AcrR family transcriptional regulator, cholesterol catabolism regulator
MPTRPRNRAFRRKADGDQEESRFDRRLGEILYFATDVFYDKGYEGASMRDLSRVSSMSLAGLYYYFESKEKLLYLIQKHTFSTIMQMLREQLQVMSDPEQRIRIFIRNHLAYFLANMKAMKVLSHEDEALSGPLGQEIKDMKREYYQLCRGLVDDFKRERGLPTDRISARIAVLSLFGMMNWIYTWHDPRRDVQAADLAEQISEIFLRGLIGVTQPRGKNTSRQGSVGNSANQKSSARKQRSASSTI